MAEYTDLGDGAIIPAKMTVEDLAECMKATDIKDAEESGDLVQCNKAGVYLEQCNRCFHAKPHPRGYACGQECGGSATCAGEQCQPITLDEITSDEPITLSVKLVDGAAPDARMEAALRRLLLPVEELLAERVGTEPSTETVYKLEMAAREARRMLSTPEGVVDDGGA